MTVTVGKDFNMLVGGESNFIVKGNSIATMEKDSTTIIGGTSVCNISGKHNLNVVKISIFTRMLMQILRQAGK